MAVKIASTQAAASTSLGNQDITTTKMGGVTPEAALFTYSLGASNGTPVDDADWGLGWTDGTSEKCFMFQADHNVGTTDTEKVHDIYCVGFWDATDQTLLGRASFVSFITNGIRINWASGEAPSTAYLINVMFFSGVTNVDVGNIAAPTTVEGTVDITAIGFEPEIVFGVYGSQIAGDSGSPGHIRSSFGVVHNGTGITQRSTGWQWRNGILTSDDRANISETYFCRTVANTGASYEMSLNAESFDSSGFTIRAKDGARADSDFYWFALDFGGEIGLSLHTTTTPTSTGEQEDTTPGFTPQALVIGPTLLDSVDTVIGGTGGNLDGGMVGLALVDDTNMYSASGGSETNVGTSNTQSLTDNVIDIPEGDGTAGVVADFPAGDVFTANGYEFDYTTVDTTGKKWWVLAFEESGTPASDSQSAYTEGLTYLPFTEPWTGSDEDPWRASHWVTGVG
jgi:hypothetical protein